MWWNVSRFPAVKAQVPGASERRVSKRCLSACRAWHVRGGATSLRDVTGLCCTFVTLHVSGVGDIMSRFYQRPCWQSWGWRFGVWLRLLLLLVLSAVAHTFLATSAQAQPSVSENELADVSREHAPFAPEDPRTIFARARAWPVHRAPFPDALLRRAVETALQPEAPWDQSRQRSRLLICTKTAPG
jgi:hypothetical protein